jgi:hypothetical protein
MSGTRVLYGNLRDNSGAYEVGIKTRTQLRATSDWSYEIQCWCSC